MDNEKIDFNNEKAIEQVEHYVEKLEPIIESLKVMSSNENNQEQVFHSEQKSQEEIIPQNEIYKMESSTPAIEIDNKISNIRDKDENIQKHSICFNKNPVLFF